MSAGSDIGTPPELAWLPVDRLDVDPAYQRTLDTPAGRKLVAKIAAEFSWMKFGALMAVPGDPDPDGPRWKIIDGQHRAAAARLVNQQGGPLGRSRGIAHVPAVVLRAASVADQAAAFVGANRDRVPVSPQALLHAALAGGDARALMLKRLCDAADIRLLPYPLARKITPARQTSAVSHLLRVLDTYGEAIAGQAIMAVADCFGDQPGGLPGLYFRVAGQYLNQGGTAERLSAVLRELGTGGLDRLSAGLNTNSALVAIVGELRRRTGGGQRTAPATAPPARTARPDPAGRGAPVRLGHAPPVKAAPAPRRDMAAAPPPDAKRAAEQEAMARFLADKGERRVMALEQIAEFLRGKGRRVVIREGEAFKDAAGQWRHRRQPVLDGAPVEIARLYQLANQLRAAAGLPAVEPAAAAEGIAAEGATAEGITT